VNDHKYDDCSVRTPQWHLVSPGKGKGQRHWQLFDVSIDYGEKKNVAAENPDVVAKLEAEYDRWWESLPPYLVNEDAVQPKSNPFKDLYWRQFGKEPKKP